MQRFSYVYKLILNLLTMKFLSQLLIVALVFILALSCQNNQSETSDDAVETIENSESKTDEVQDKSAETEMQDGPASETSIAPVKVNPAEIQAGDIILGHEVKSVNYQDEFVFEIVFIGEFCFDGHLSLGMSADIEFTPNEATRDKAQIVIDDIQKPLYMWTTFTNTKTFQDGLGEDILQKLNQGEMMELSICFKNYKVIAMETEIKAEAEFVSYELN